MCGMAKFHPLSSLSSQYCQYCPTKAMCFLLQIISATRGHCICHQRRELLVGDCNETIRKGKHKKGDTVSWASYHASLNISANKVTAALSQLLPLFYEKAATAAMIKHGMDVQRKAINYLNPGQIPVYAMDAPLFVLSKLVQWKWPYTHGEDKQVTTALTEAGVASSGMADSFLKAAHLTRTRHAHQVTALALAKLKRDAFLQTDGPHDEETEESWRQDMAKTSPTFLYWDTILKIELIGLIFVRAHREKNFELYVKTLKTIAPWFFSLDHQHYARWVPIHIRDMENLPQSVLNEFIEGHWVIPKSSKRFSTIPIDQAHEQNNELVKGSGGAVGLTENPIAFRKWMISGPEQARLLKEFEDENLYNNEDTDHHHEEGLSTQKTFVEQALNLVQVIEDMGNPFLDNTSELLALDTRNVLDESVAITVQTIEALGTDQYSTRPVQDSDIDAFFKHENHPFPPSLSDGGKLCFGKKSDLLQNLTQNDQKDLPNIFDATALDGAAIVHLLPTANSTTFDEYADNIFLPYIVNCLSRSSRVDVVWDIYISDSIKKSTREKRGKGFRRKVAGKNKIPGKWKDFLRDSSNKEELFSFLSNKVHNMDLPDGKEAFATDGAGVLASGSSQNDMCPCDHEEADTRLIIHVQNALKNGANTCVVRTVDTDVLVILIGRFHHLLTLNKDADVWISFGTGKNFTYYSVNAICCAIGRGRSIALPLFHSFTGCDTTSCFHGRGKQMTWQAWNSYPEVTQAFTYMAMNFYANATKDDVYFKLLERFVVVLYDKTSSLDSVDEARKELFCQKGRSMENIPPTQDALFQHVKRAAYQACSELVKCVCKSTKGCGGKCACKKSNWRCTELCIAATVTNDVARPL
ncbi:hypothetical protein GQR58_020959 [Nymphon striatum]|nr:hypothetical protein GQR58_020959 [Nymphon striatum]